ncbi:hypothetical protein [Paenibacillus sp. B-A-8]|uniref:hypothetical protein n=1 Tax=Paenibacillus sp. B-A-8 TaxID=3400419 RepID=UPI003B029DF5
MSEDPTKVIQTGVKKKQKFIIPAAIIFCIIVIVGLFLVFKSNPVKDFTEAMSINDFTAAATIYNEKMTEQNQSEVASLIVQRIEKIEKDFIGEAVDFNEVSASFKDLEQIIKDSVPELGQARGRVQTLHNSRLTFERGMGELDSGNYETAIDTLSLITPTDGNYQKALEAIEQATSFYKDESIQTISSMINDGLFDDALAAIDTALVTFPDASELLERRQNINSMIEQQRMEEERRLEEEQQLEEERQLEEKQRLEEEKDKTPYTEYLNQVDFVIRVPAPYNRALEGAPRHSTKYETTEQYNVNNSGANGVLILFYDDSYVVLSGANFTSPNALPEFSDGALEGTNLESSADKVGFYTYDDVAKIKEQYRDATIYLNSYLDVGGALVSFGEGKYIRIKSKTLDYPYIIAENYHQGNAVE